MTFSRFETILKTAMRKTAHVLTSSRGCEVGCPQSGNFENKDVDWRILTLFETIFWKYREYFENKEGKLCILSLFDTCCENFEICKAKWCILTLLETYARRFLGGGGTHGSASGVVIFCNKTC